MIDRVLVLCKGNISSIPPVMNYIISLLVLKKKVHLVCGEIDKKTEMFLLDFGQGDLSITNLNLGTSNNKIGKWIKYRKGVYQVLAQKKFNNIWLSTLDTAICVWS